MALPNFTNLDNYYGDSSQYGEYQYTTLDQMVNNFMYEQDDDSYVAHVDRNKVALIAKKGIRELYFDVVNEVIALEFDLNEQLIIPLPHDYINYVRVSYVDESGKLHPLAIDRTNNLAQAYLQDVDYDFLYDMDGDILKGSHIQNLPSNSSLNLETDYDSFYGNLPKNFNVDRSKLFKNGSFRVDKTEGVMQFSSAVDGRTIVIEYISDGLYQRQDTEIKIHKFAEEALYSFVYYNLVKRRRSVPANEKDRAKREWFNMRKTAKKRISPITIDNVRQVLKGSSKFIKD